MKRVAAIRLAWYVVVVICSSQAHASRARTHYLRALSAMHLARVKAVSRATSSTVPLRVSFALVRLLWRAACYATPLQPANIASMDTTSLQGYVAFAHLLFMDVNNATIYQHA